MEKLELWEQNEPLLADKLNNEVKTVNEIIDKINKNPQPTGGSMGSITYPQFGTTRLELLQMWANDGEGVVLSGHDFGFLGDAGLYARENEAVLNGKRFIPNDRKLKKIANWACLQDGGILYQEITLTNGQITNSELKYTNNALPNDTDTKIYRKLSRIVTDCKAWSCAKGRFKAIAVNETRISKSSSSGGSTGEIICYDVKAVECSPNNIVKVCKKQSGNKITFEIEGFYCFDPEFFCVYGCGVTKKVTLNTIALYDLANEVANNIQVCVQACGIVDKISSGQIKVATNGLSLVNDEYTASTNVSCISCVNC